MRSVFAFVLCFVFLPVFAEPTKKPAAEKPPTNKVDELSWTKWSLVNAQLARLSAEAQLLQTQIEKTTEQFNAKKAEREKLLKKLRADYGMSDQDTFTEDGQVQRIGRNPQENRK